MSPLAEHRQAFENVKTALASEPLATHLPTDRPRLKSQTTMFVAEPSLCIMTRSDRRSISTVKGQEIQLSQYHVARACPEDGTEPTDEAGVFIQAVSDFLSRDVVIITSSLAANCTNHLYFLHHKRGYGCHLSFFTNLSSVLWATTSAWLSSVPISSRSPHSRHFPENASGGSLPRMRFLLK